MKKLIITCDLCSIECPQPDFSVFSGAIRKLNNEGKLERMIFEGHYCEEDSGKILTAIEQIKNA